MNTTTTKTLNEIKANFSEVTTNVIDGMDLYDYNHQCADGDADVIYYAKANDKVNNATSEQLDDAEDQYKEYGFEFISRQDLNTKLAFFIVLEEYREQHEQEIKEDKSKIDEYIDSISGYGISDQQDKDLDNAIDIQDTLQELV